MSKTILMIADPVEGLDLSSDSTVALSEGFLEFGYRVMWALPQEISLLNGVPMVSNHREIVSVDEQGTPHFSPKSPTDDVPVVASQFEKVFVRKDPPFDESYTDLCWILSQSSKALVVNEPKSLLTFHEKLTPWHMAHAGILPAYMMVPTLVSSDPQALLRFAQEQFRSANDFLTQFSGIEEFKNFKFKMICKPWRGHGGRGIRAFDSLEALGVWLNSECRTTPHGSQLAHAIILQPFLPELHKEGDRRVFIVNGEVVFDFVRYPAPGKIEANLARGGSARLEPMSEDLVQTCTSIARYLKSNGVLIAGLDFIGHRLTEVNVTSPTGIRAFEKLKGQRITKLIASRFIDGGKTSV